MTVLCDFCGGTGFLCKHCQLPERRCEKAEESLVTCWVCEGTGEFELLMLPEAEGDA